ncbi:YigZ family protein [Alkalihalobacillus sp. AL-G]|uniref:YigZ family protein n=1 Tax=Alkalihalobacillus sp. AL-G TaxID=2926399 RepID=UPI00272C9977|nr:YigZ family protein [Alkalihalobacillus sp. AL-G]WLD92983.1 YigZ family protein [Alkalihalobacillus sp. AL-G]
MLSSYYTVKGYGQHEHSIQRSRFIAYINRAESEQEAQEFIQQIKKKHHDASHNCSAYLIGENDEIQKANDDGEPSGTAGVPILEVLKKRKLKNSVVVITRYFGGIKLGAGGLIRAYGTSTSEGLNATGIVERVLMHKAKCTIDYHLLGKVENELRNHETYLLDEIEYLADVTLTIFVHLNEETEFFSWIQNLTSNNVDIKLVDKQYLDRPAK